MSYPNHIGGEIAIFTVFPTALGLACFSIAK